MNDCIGISKIRINQIKLIHSIDQLIQLNELMNE